MTAGVRARTRRLWSPGRGTTAHGSPTGPTGAAATLRVAGAEDVVELPPPHAATVSATSTTAAPRMGGDATAHGGWGRAYAAVIMPAPTVSFVASSMRMNEPVDRLWA